MLGQLQLVHHEERGLAPARELLRVLDQVQQHRLAAASVLRDPGAPTASLQRQQQAVDAALAQLNSALAQLGDSELQSSVQDWQQAWRALVGEHAQHGLTVGDSNARHDEQTEGLLTLIDEVAHASGLGTDSDGRRYNLQLTVLWDLPRLVEEQARVRDHGIDILLRGEVSLEDRAYLERSAEQIRQNSPCLLYTSPSPRDCS